MKKQVTKLTEKEAEIMERLWSEGPQTIRELLASYPEPKPHFNTVSTTVRILRDKGFVEHVGERNGAFTYGALIESNALSGSSLARVVKCFFNNSYKAAISALVDDEKISVDELREIIAMVEKRKKD